MDEKKSNIRLVKTGGRKVTKTTTEYDKAISGEKNNRSSEGKSVGTGRTIRGLEQKVRYQKRQKQRRLKRQRIRALTILIAVVLFVVILLFMTPLFNIRSLTVDGNSIVPVEQFQEKLKPLIGENIFRTGSGKIRKTLKTIPYINTVEVQKKLFPPSVKVIVTEYTPLAVMRAADKNLIVNNQLRVLSDDSGIPDGIPVITGISVKNYELGEIIEADEPDKINVAAAIVSTLETTGIIDKVVEIDVNSLTDITLNYDDRITVQCGTQLDIERKLRLLRETVMSNSLAENARGNMNLSETGKAIYTP